MLPREIRAELVRKGITYRQLAAELGVHPSGNLIYMIVSGRGTSARAAWQISKRLGIPVSRLWPGRYPQLEAEERAA